MPTMPTTGISIMEAELKKQRTKEEQRNDLLKLLLNKSTVTAKSNVKAGDVEKS